MAQAAAPQDAHVGRVTATALFLRFLTIGSISFGGGIIAYLRTMLVDQTRWLTADDFLAALEVSQTLPGTNSVNMAVIIGDRFAGWIGAGAAFLGLMLPGTVLILILAAASESARHHPIGHAALAGVTACAVGILAAITLRTGAKQFINPLDLLFLALTFVGMSIFKIPLLLLVVVLGGISVYIRRPRPSAAS